jgi:hypothetical protein
MYDMFKGRRQNTEVRGQEKMRESVAGAQKSE